MSIAPPTDIILDVAQAADPQRLQVATQKLNAMASGAGGPTVDFATLLDAAKATPKAAGGSLSASTLLTAHPSTIPASTSPYRKFEAVLLQNMMQEILPKDDALFGDASSADICRTMLAEQLATQLSKTGSFGIAKMVEKAEAAKQAAAAAAQASTPPAGST